MASFIIFHTPNQFSNFHTTKLKQCTQIMYPASLSFVYIVGRGIYTVYAYTYSNLELENRGHTGGLRSRDFALGRRLQVQAPSRGCFSPVATFKLCS